MNTLDIPIHSLAKDLIANIQNVPVLVVGDLLLDEYIVGKVDRISPEAPVPVVSVENKWHRLGGAGNVARNIATLGGRPVLYSVVGKDQGNYLLHSLLKEHAITSSIIADQDRPTSVKTRIMAHNQQVVRVDTETTTTISPALASQLLNAMKETIEPGMVIIVSDYGKGVVSQPFLDSLQKHCRSLDPVPRILVDPKVRNFPSYTGCHLLTPNRKEAGQCANTPSPRSRDEILRTGIEIFKRIKCEHLLITLGPQGMAYFDSPSSVFHLPTAAQNVYDVTGAGDTVIATLGLALASGASELNACIIANIAASIVVKEIGTACASPSSLLAALSMQTDQQITSWLTSEA